MSAQKNAIESQIAGRDDGESVSTGECAGQTVPQVTDGNHLAECNDKPGNPYGALPGEWSQLDLVLELTEHLLPVVSNPNAIPAPESSIKQPGKLPSIYRQDGYMVGIGKWTEKISTSREVSRWEKVPDYGICLQTRRVRAIDVDVGEPLEAGDIEATIVEHIGFRLPIRRRSNSSKFLVLFKMPGDFTKRRFKTAGGVIEFLANGQQAVICGTHPSGARYEFDGGLPDHIPQLSDQQFEDLWALLNEKFGTEPSVEARKGIAPVKPRSMDDVKDPLVDYLEARGLVLDYHRSGRLDITCPFADDHTTESGNSSTSYFPAGVGGFGRGHFKCQHSHCIDRLDGEFKDAIGWSIEGFEELPEPTPEEAAEQAEILRRNELQAERMAQKAIERARFAEAAAEERLDRSDTANVNLMHQYTKGNLRYLPDIDQWLYWTGDRWEVDKDKSILQKASRTVGEHYHREAVQRRKDAEVQGLPPDTRKRLAKVADDTEKWATQCRNHQRLNAMQAQAKMDCRFTLALDSLNRDPHLLGVQNGVVDLKSGRLQPDARDQYITQRAAFNFDPLAHALRWSQFIEEITAKPVLGEIGKYTARPNYARYVQKALGYCLTGMTIEHKMFICCGDGGNGKNVMLDMLKELLPDYVAIIAPALLVASSKAMDANAPSAATAALAGKRYAIASEAQEGARLDVAMVKAHTGNQYITARFLHANDTTFAVTHKLWLMTNHKPRIDDMDAAIRGRLHILPFDMRWNRPGDTDRDPSLPDGDKYLVETLRTESAGILAWLIEGARMYYAEGLEPPEEVKANTLAYLAEQDVFSAWRTDRCSPCNADDGTQASKLFADYQAWCEVRGRKARPDNQKAFSDALQKAGYTPFKRRHVYYPINLITECIEGVAAPTDKGFETIDT